MSYPLLTASRTSEPTKGNNQNSFDKLQSSTSLAKPVFSSKSPICPQCGSKIVTTKGSSLYCNNCKYEGQSSGKKSQLEKAG